jgi:hypothetical protein
MGRRKLRGAGSGWCGSAAEVLESHWLWADVQVEGGVEPDARRERRNGAFGGSGIAAREESTYQGESK